MSPVTDGGDECNGKNLCNGIGKNQDACIMASVTYH